MMARLDVSALLVWLTISAPTVAASGTPAESKTALAPSRWDLWAAGTANGARAGVKPAHRTTDIANDRLPGGGRGGGIDDDNMPSASRDPFAPALHSTGEGREVHPLERFAVGELRLVGTVDGVDPPRALIEDPDGLGFVITPGSIVGAERRRVVSIGAGRIVLETSPGDPAGNRQIVILAGQPNKPERP